MNITDILTEPWVVVEDGAALVKQLKREAAPGHPLYGVAVEAIAWRLDNDDVLFKTQEQQLAVVHLVWSEHPQDPPDWPWTVFYSDLDHWVSECLMPDSKEYESWETTDDTAS